jgi:hypothetical protein
VGRRALKQALLVGAEPAEAGGDDSEELAEGLRTQVLFAQEYLKT